MATLLLALVAPDAAHAIAALLAPVRLFVALLVAVAFAAPDDGTPCDCRCLAPAVTPRAPPLA